MNLKELLSAKRAHVERFANEKGAAGEALSIAASSEWIPRPKGAALKNMLGELAATGVVIKASSFDAIAAPVAIDLADRAQVQRHLASMVFVEIKSASQKRVREGFGGFFFALTESEIAAAEQLGDRHKVALHNTRTGEILLTSVAEIVARARSMTWQLSVQL